MKWTKWDWLYAGICLAVGLGVGSIYLLGMREGMQQQYDDDAKLIEALTMTIDG